MLDACWLSTTPKFQIRHLCLFSSQPDFIVLAASMATDWYIEPL